MTTGEIEAALHENTFVLRKIVRRDDFKYFKGILHWIVSFVEP